MQQNKREPGKQYPLQRVPQRNMWIALHKQEINVGYENKNLLLLEARCILEFFLTSFRLMKPSQVANS